MRESREARSCVYFGKGLARIGRCLRNGHIACTEDKHFMAVLYGRKN